MQVPNHFQCERTLTIEYLGASAEYPITILFSGVSVVEYYANGALKDLEHLDEARC